MFDSGNAFTQLPTDDFDKFLDHLKFVAEVSCETEKGGDIYFCDLGSTSYENLPDFEIEILPNSTAKSGTFIKIPKESYLMTQWFGDDILLFQPSTYTKTTDGKEFIRFGIPIL